MTKTDSSMDGFPPAIDPAHELVSHLYESLRQLSACEAFREGLARQLEVCLHSIVYRSPDDSLVVTYGSTAERRVFVPQPRADLPPLRAFPAGAGEQLVLHPDRSGSPSGPSRWSLLWQCHGSLVQLLIEFPSRTVDPASFIRRRRALLNYVLPHMGAAYGIFSRQQNRSPRLSGIQTLHAMLPLPLVIVCSRDKSRLANVQALRLTNRQQTICAGQASSPAGPIPERPLKAVALEKLGVAQATLGHQVYLLAGPKAFAAARPELLAQCFGLTASEAELCGCALTGKSPQGMADELGLSINTVKARLKPIYRRLGVSSIAQLASFLYFHPAYWTANYRALPGPAATPRDLTNERPRR